LIQACQLAEQSLAAVAASRQLLWKRKREEGSSKRGKGNEVDHKCKGTIPKCMTCGKFHKRECYKNKRTCFICQDISVGNAQTNIRNQPRRIRRRIK
jgi:hypothetical protein